MYRIVPPNIASHLHNIQQQYKKELVQPSFLAGEVGSCAPPPPAPTAEILIAISQ